MKKLTYNENRRIPRRAEGLGLTGIESDAQGIRYFVEGQRIGIAGRNGMIILTKRQAVEIAAELSGILEVWM